MDLEEKHLLEENLATAKENNRLLKKVHNLQKLAQYARIFYWIIIFGMAFGAFYFVEPFLGSISNIYSGGISNIDNIQDIGKSIPDVKKLQEMVKELNQ